MSDTDLRRLERAFRETGALEAHAAWIGARVRAGELGEHRARLAAWLGHGAAARALGVARGRPGPGMAAAIEEAGHRSRAPRASDEARWVLTGEGAPPAPGREPELDERQVQSRIALAAAREALSVVGGIADAELDQALGALDAWLACPCAEHRASLVQAGRPGEPMSEDDVLGCFVPAEQARIRTLVNELRGPPDEEGAPAPFFFAPWPAFAAPARLGGDELAPAAERLAFALSRTRRGAAWLAAWGALEAPWTARAAERAVVAAAAVAGADELRAAVVAAVGPWLLREDVGG